MQSLPCSAHMCRKVSLGGLQHHRSGWSVNSCSAQEEDALKGANTTAPVMLFDSLPMTVVLESSSGHSWRLLLCFVRLREVIGAERNNTSLYGVLNFGVQAQVSQQFLALQASSIPSARSNPVR